MPVFTKDNLRNTFSAVFSNSQVENMNKLHDYLKNNLKWSDRNIAAVLGNVMQESAFNYGNVSSAGAVGAFQFLGDRKKDYDSWRQKNGYKDGALSLATYLDYVIKNRIDPRWDMVINARQLLENKNHTDSINANKVLKWAEPAIENGTFYPISDLSDVFDTDDMTLEDFTSLWSNTIEKAAPHEKNNLLRINYAMGIYKLMGHKFGGKMTYLDFLKKGNKIHIKESLKGSFTRYCGGNVTEECIRRGKNSPNSKIRKKATFAANARTWSHKEGGLLKGAYGLNTNLISSYSPSVDPYDYYAPLSLLFSRTKTKNLVPEDIVFNPRDPIYSSTSTTSASAKTHDWSRFRPYVSTSETSLNKPKKRKRKSGSRADRNNNPLNIRFNSGNNWLGRKTSRSDDAFEEFESRDYGWRAGYRLMSNHIKNGNNTLRKLITKWAPESDNNNTSKYITDVARAVGINPDDTLNPNDGNLLPRIAKAMAIVESGHNIDLNDAVRGYKFYLGKHKK